ncbi:MAG: hypothetical protein M1833_000727 [Piccolia ochrophora]|nr:MAG: hypothetical protein M1833_000727 [Piccolia ochrophora]
MASEEDNFDIDIYGDGDDYKGETQAGADAKESSEGYGVDSGFDGSGQDPNGEQKQEVHIDEVPPGTDSHMTNDDGGAGESHPILRADGSTSAQVDMPKQPPQKQGVKRKEGPDDRPVDNGATTAIYISDLHWWSTDDDIRGWINQSECEDELKDITFSEHKVNGKSKGQAFVEFLSPQAASAVKRKIDSFGEGQPNFKKHVVSFAPTTTNPYRTLPKDAPARGKDAQRGHDSRTTGSFNSSGGMVGSPNTGQMNFGGGNSGGAFRGGRGGYNRGGPMNNISGGFQNRSFSGPMPAGPPSGFQGGPMGGFQSGPMGGMQQFGGFPNRGGMMGGMRGGPGGNRGGRGGIGPGAMMPGMGGINGMGGMMGAMPGQMPGMGGNMSMGPMGMQGTTGFTTSNMVGRTSGHAFNEWFRRVSPPESPNLHYNHTRGLHHQQALFAPAGHPAPLTTPPSTPQNVMLNQVVGHNIGQGGFQGPQPHFNPAFFGQNQGGGGDGNWNPHGTKRQRPE